MMISYTLENIHEAAERLLDHFPGPHVFALQGSMGSGKTTLVTELCKVLQVQGTVSSPTFPIINQYHLPGGEAVYHIDLYRLDGAEEAIAAGVEEALYSGSYCFVEWPELAPGIFPGDVVQVQISVVSEQERVMHIPG